MSKKFSQFTAKDTVADEDFINITGRTNRRISWPNFLDEVYDRIVTPFIYPTIDALQEAPLRADEDSPVYVRVEETEYRLYKITNIAPGVNDITLDNGNTATAQSEYRDIGFVVGPETSTIGALATYDNLTGTLLANGPAPSTVGVNLIEFPDSAADGYFRKKSDNTLELLTGCQLKTNLSLNNVDNTSDANKPISTSTQSALDLKAPLLSPELTGNPTAPTPDADDDSESIATTEYVQGELSDRVQSVATIADLSVISPSVGQRIVTQGAIIPDLGASDYVVQAASGAPDGFARVLLANGNHAVLIPKNNTVTPEQFGAIGDGATSDAAAFVRMANFIKSSGGGCVKGTPGQTYLLADTSSVPGALIDLGAIPHFSMDFCGATIKGSNTLAQGNINLFTATNGKNITIKNAVCNFPLLADGSGDPQGVSLFVGYDKCENIEISGLSGYGGLNSVVAFERSNTGGYLDYYQQARGINIHDIDLLAVGYGINCRFNGSFLRAKNVKLDYCHRGYFPYGVTDHDVDIVLNDYDATGCRIWSVDGRFTQNIKLYARVKRLSGASRPATSIVQLAFGSGSGGMLKNINIFVDAELEGLHGMGILFTTESNPASGMHLIDGLTVRGIVRNPIGRYLSVTESGGGTLSSVRVDNLDIGGECINQASGSIFPIHNSTTVNKVVGLSLSGAVNNNLELAGGDTVSSASIVDFYDCNAGRLYSTGRGNYINCSISDASGINPKLCTFRNTMYGNILLNKSLPRHVLPPNENVIQPDLIAARAVFQSASSPMVLTLAKGTHIYPDLLPSVGVAGCVYDFSIGVVGVSSSANGAYVGRVMIKVTGSDVTAVQLIDVAVAHSSGTALQVSDLSVSILDGSPVFTLTSTLTSYTQAQIIIRDI